MKYDGLPRLMEALPDWDMQMFFQLDGLPAKIAV
jgi:hypothetical protein